jgi:hypothetical protein
MDWHTIDSGGGTSSNGQFTLDGTIGQHDAGTSCAGAFMMESGFWYGGGVCPTPPPTPGATGTVPTATRTGTALRTSTSPPGNTTTRTPSRTSTPTATPTEYIVIISTGTIVPGTDDIGNHCHRCTTRLRLPFPVTLYDTTFSNLEVGSNGTLGFERNDNPDSSRCMPDPAFSFGILPFWADLTTVGDRREGIYTSVNGSAPTREFNIEWVASTAGGETVNFQVRLFERSSMFELIYGDMGSAGRDGTIGVQRDTGSRFTQVQCGSQAEVPGSPAGGIGEGVRLIFTFPGGGATPTPTACPLQFTDVQPGSTFYPYVRCLACRGIISGYADGTFRPGNNVTRGQITKIVANAVGLNDDPGAPLFADVPPDNTFYTFTQRLAVRGYMSGYPCGGPGEPCGPTNQPYFRPHLTATRGQLSKIVSNAAGFSEAAAGQYYADVPPANPFYNEIMRLTNRGIVGGYPCGRPLEPCDGENRPYFRWGIEVTRGQASKVVANTFYPGCVTP